MKDINNCASRVLFKTGKTLGTPILAVSVENNLDHFYIYRKGKQDEGWDIDLRNPIFIGSKAEMTKDEKEELYDLMKDNWNDIVDSCKAICKEDCEDTECPMYNREFPISCPDYRNL